MENKIQFQQNANVVTAGGQPVGRIERVVLNPETKVLTHIVVRQGSIYKKQEKVVPIDLVAETSAEQIELRNEAGDLHSFPPLEEKHIVPSEETPGGGGVPSSQNISPGVYGTPMTNSAIPQVPSQKYVTYIDLKIPEGTVALKEGARVTTLEGAQVGKVERVLVEVPTDKATHLLVASGLLKRVKKLIPIKWVMMMGEKEVHLDVKRDAVDTLGDA